MACPHVFPTTPDLKPCCWKIGGQPFNSRPLLTDWAFLPGKPIRLVTRCLRRLGFKISQAGVWLQEICWQQLLGNWHIWTLVGSHSHLTSKNKKPESVISVPVLHGTPASQDLLHAGRKFVTSWNQGLGFRGSPAQEALIREDRGICILFLSAALT